VLGQAGSGNGQFTAPRDVAVGPNGLIYVLDSGKHRVQKLAPDGAFLSAWGHHCRWYENGEGCAASDGAAGSMTRGALPLTPIALSTSPTPGTTMCKSSPPVHLSSPCGASIAPRRRTRAAGSSGDRAMSLSPQTVWSTSVTLASIATDLHERRRVGVTLGKRGHLGGQVQ
jgi:hypothetical protein